VRTRLRIVAATVLGFALLAGCTDGGPGSLLGGDGGGGATTGVVAVAPVDRLEPPTVAGSTLDGGQLDVADLRGDVVVLNIWGSWCGPCRAEAPALERTAKAFEPEGVRFVGLNTKDSDDAARAFVRAVDMSYPSIVDPDGEVQLSLRDHVPPTSVPSTIVLDRDGRVAVTVVGPVTQQSLTDVVQPVVDEA
jgi:thiol-disulfide isomerase/thioredoxin